MIPGAAGDLGAVAAAKLIAWFERTGYVRRCDPLRRARDGQAYKKGAEVRLVLASQDEVRTVRRLLRAVGLLPSGSYGKHRRFVQPAYGEAAVDWFLTRLPSGRERAAMGFSPSGQRVVRRSRSRHRSVA